MGNEIQVVVMRRRPVEAARNHVSLVHRDPGVELVSSQRDGAITVLRSCRFDAGSEEERTLFLLPEMLPSTTYWSACLNAHGMWRVVFTRFGGFSDGLAWMEQNQSLPTLIRVPHLSSFTTPVFVRWNQGERQSAFLALSDVGEFCLCLFSFEGGSCWHVNKLVSGATEGRLLIRGEQWWLVFKRPIGVLVGGPGEIQGRLCLARGDLTDGSLNFQVDEFSVLPIDPVYQFDACLGPDESVFVFAMDPVNAKLFQVSSASAQSIPRGVVYAAGGMRSLASPAVIIRHNEAYLALLESTHQGTALLTSILAL